MAAPIGHAPGFQPGSAVPLFRTRVAGPLGTGHRFPIAVTRDGQRFLIYVETRDATPEPITVVLNWKAMFLESKK